MGARYRAVRERLPNCQVTAMWSYAAQRLLLAIPTLLGVSIIMFVLIHVVPGDPLASLVGTQGSTGFSREDMEKKFGFDKPIVVQYGIWLGKAVTGDFGRSFSDGTSVGKTVLEAVANTFILAGTASVLCIILGMVLGTVAGFYQGRWPDKVASVIAIAGLSLPQYWVALLLVIVFSVNWRVLPAQGMQTLGGSDSVVLDVIEHMIIPVVALTWISLGVITRMVRASVLEALNQEYVTALRAKGMKPYRVVLHVVKNAMPTVMTVLGLVVAYNLGGSVLVEAVMNWPGAGGLLNYAVLSRDITVIQTTVLVLASFFVVINVIVDILNSVIDPRIRRSD